MRVKLTLFDIRADLPAAWASEFEGVADVESVISDLANLDRHDCLVSPANSFGIMDGGLDAVIAHELPEVQARVSAAIARTWWGEQPVGTSMLVETGSDRFRWLAHTPTMRSPRPIEPHAVYSATRALLIALRRHNERGAADRIESVACPGLGTATGRVPADTAARMMRKAYDHVMLSEPGAFPSWQAVGTALHETGPDRAGRADDAVGFGHASSQSPSTARRRVDRAAGRQTPELAGMADGRSVQDGLAAGCVFCEIVRGESPSWRVYEDESAYAFLNIFPATEWHALVVPKAHYANVFDSPAEELVAVTRAVKGVVDLYQRVLGISNVQVINSSGAGAQQDVFHFHFHIVPRQLGDGQDVRWSTHPEWRGRFDGMTSKLRDAGAAEAGPCGPEADLADLRRGIPY